MRETIFPLLLLATICSPYLLHGGDSKPIPTKLTLKAKEETFPDFVRELVALGEKADQKNEPFLGKLANLLGLESSTYGRGGGVGKELTSDFLDHRVEAILDRSAKEPMVTAIIFVTGIVIEKVGNEIYHYRVSPSGKLEKVVRIAGPYDGANKPIPGAGKASVLNINDPEVQYRFQHEIDFWLKNMFRRKKTAP